MAEYVIIAGTGSLPRILKENIPDAKVIGFHSDVPEIEADLMVSFGEIGKIINFGRENGIKKMIFAGALKKPESFAQIKPDGEGAKLLARIVAGKIFTRGKDVGDHSILSKIIDFMESRGFEIVAANDVVKELLAPAGLVVGAEPTTQMMEDILFGMNAAKNLGKMDIGQAVVVEDNSIIATENVHGTSDLIKRAGELKRSYGGILVKACKPQQDVRADLPSIGEHTIIQIAAAGLVGVAVESGRSLIIDREAVINRAKQLGVFVFGA